MGRTSQVEFFPAVILTPDCDIYQHKVNTVVVIQIIPVETFIERNGMAERKANLLRGEVEQAKASNPGAFSRSGVFFLPGSTDLDFPDSLAIFNMQCIVPIQFPDGDVQGNHVIADSIGGQENLWFRIKHSDFRARLVNEFSRQMWRIGLPDAV